VSQRSPPSVSQRSAPAGKGSATAADGAHQDKSGKALMKASMELTADKLAQLVEQQQARAEEAMKEASEISSLHASVGEAFGQMIDDGKKAKAIFDEMDKNHDGHISKMEFRQALRGLGLMNKEYGAHEVDALFEELDKDHGGDLDLQEVTGALKLLRAESVKQNERKAKSKVTAEKWQARAEHTKSMAAVVVTWEQAQVKLATLKETPSTASRFGALLMKKNLKPADVFTKWDLNGDGSIDRDEFKKDISGLGFESTDEEAGELFEQWDKDGDGTISYEEMRIGIKSMHEAQVNAVAEVKQLTKQLTQLEKEARAAQMEVQEAMNAEDRERAAEEEAAKAAAEAEAARKAEAEEARRRAKEEKERKAREEKEAFDAKIQARRHAQAHGDAPGATASAGAPAGEPAGAPAAAVDVA
jgi:Ca2+-binding EF-hand superfamily protein